MTRPTLYLTLFVCLFALLMTACGEVAIVPTAAPTSTATPRPTATLAATSMPLPDTLSVQIGPGEDLAAFRPQDPLILTFNQPMDPGNLHMPLIFSPAVRGTAAWNEDYTRLTFTPDDGFAPSRNYQVTLHAMLKSASGLEFDRIQRWRITMLSAPTVKQHIPNSEAITSRQPVIRLRFSQPMNRTSVETALSVEPALPVQLSWQEDELIITPLERLAYGITYYFTLAKTAVDEQGDPLVHDYTWRHTLKGALARITKPTTNEPGSPLILTFNYPMETASVQQALIIEPAMAGELTWNMDRTVATFTPADRWLSDTRYNVSFNRPLRDAAGEMIPAPNNPAFFITQPPIMANSPRGDNVHPMTTIRLTFDRLMDETTTAAAFQMTPSISGTITWDETTLIFEPAEGYLATNTNYTVTLHPTATDLNGETVLQRPYSWSFHTLYQQDIANFGWGPNAQVVDVNGRRAVQFVAYTSDALLTFELYSLNLNQFLDRYASGFRGVAGWEDNRLISTEGTTLAKSWTMPLAPSPVQYGNVQEMIIPEDVPPGLYILNLKAGMLNDQLILVLTQNTITVKQAEGQLVAWVTDINGDPLPGAEVIVYARDGVQVSSGRTNEAGVYRTTITRDPQPLIVVARSGDDITASGLSNEWRSGGYGWWSWWEPAPAANHYAAYIYTERPIYQPDQTVYFKAIVRQDDDAVLSLAPAGTAVTARIRDARNNVVQTFSLTTNHFGTVNGEFHLADGAMLGEYAVEIVLDGETHRQIFKVEEYRKPDYQVTVTADAEKYVVGDRAVITIDTAYFFGEPVANARIEINTFRLAERGWWDQSSNDPYIWYKSYEPVRRGQTDANGRFTFTLPAEMGYENLSRDWQSSLRESLWAIEATVDDGSRQTVSGFVVLRVYNTAERLRLDTGSYFQRPGEPFTIRARAETIFGEPVDGRSLTLTLRRWSSNGYETVVQSAELVTGEDGRASLPFTVEQPGFYQLRLAGADSQGKAIQYETYVYAFSNQSSSWYGSQNSGLSVQADRNSYAPGDTARLLIESSFSGPALLTFERGTTRREQLVQLTAPVTMVEVAIQPDDTPNIYVTVNAWEAQDTTLTAEMWQSIPDSRLRTASVNLSVPATDKILTVTITPDKEAYAPRENATFTVRVTNGAGVPVSAELSLALVDEAIFALSPELAGPIFDAFYDERANIVRTYDALALLRDLGGGRGGGGGGGDMTGNPRQDFPDTAAWFPVLHTDFNGEATVTVTLPDSLTSWRLTAKATTADTQVGEAAANITTKQPVIVRPILPRALTAGDTAHLSALVHNYSDATQTVAVTLSIHDSPFTIHHSSAHTVTIPAGGVQVVGWAVTAETAGEAQMVVRASVGDQTMDAVQLPLTVRPLAVPDVTTQVGQFNGSFNTSVTLPEGALPMSSVRLELSRSIAGTLLEGLEYLTGFPYGCVEQTMSRALPNAVVGRAFHQLGVGNPTLQADLPAKINASLQRLYGFQHNDGGWGWWYDDSTHDYQTAWVIFGLATIEQGGYEVDPGVIERGVQWLNDNLSSMDIRTRAYALYSMATAGQPNVEATLALAEQIDRLDSFSQAGLALALHEAGHTAEARTVITRLAETAVRTDDGRVYWSGAAQDGYYGYKTMASDTRTTALALSAFSQIRPGHELEAGMVRWLMGQRRQEGWGTTNETAYAIIGLTDHLLATSFNEAATATQYSVLLNGQPVASGSLGRGEPAVTLEISAEQLQTGPNALQITQSGSGRLYYTLNTRVYLAQSEIEASGVVQVSRVYQDAVTGQAIETAEAGQLVEVQIAVTLPENAAYVIVEDNLPGGLEPLNEGLNTTSHVATAYEEPRYYWERYGYNYKEIHGDRVSFFITEMGSGQHVYTYYARATHSGTFVAMPVEVYAMYDLATWGRSASGRLVIGE